MSNLFNIDIVNPEQSFLSKDNVFEVVIPAVEGEIGILKDHIRRLQACWVLFARAVVENDNMLK